MNAERALLERLIAGPATGDALAHESGQTRAAVWKRIEGLREAGVAIDAQPGRGYALAQPVSLLEADTILAALPEAVRGDVAALEVAWSLDSTNSELLRRPVPEAGKADGKAEVLLAERQTGGRGRRGRSWASPLAANLYLSVMRGFEGGLARLGGLSLVAGVAAAEALQAFGIEGVRLKWPNDLVIVDDGAAGDAAGWRKLGGLLVEGGGEHAGPVRAVIGLGLNVRMPAASAAGIDQPWIDLTALTAQAPDRNRITAALLTQLLPALALFDRGGLAPFLSRHAAFDALTGREVVVRGGADAHTVTHAGVALGLAADGALRVRLPEGERIFHAGEVSVRTR